MSKSHLVAVAIAATLAVPATAATPLAGGAGAEVKRGEYLVSYGGCHDCHTPKKMTPTGPAPDMARALSGHPSDAKLPAVPAGLGAPDQWAAVTNGDLTAWAGPWGVSFAANLTPDSTGIANWTADQFRKAMRTGKHMGAGRPILPPMPWFSVAVLTDRDLNAVFAYLKSVKPIRNEVPAPLPPK